MFLMLCIFLCSFLLCHAAGEVPTLQGLCLKNIPITENTQISNSTIDINQLVDVRKASSEVYIAREATTKNVIIARKLTDQQENIVTECFLLMPGNKRSSLDAAWFEKIQALYKVIPEKTPDLEQAVDSEQAD